MISRRLLLAAPAVLAGFPAHARRRPARTRAVVYASAACTCCHGWIAHMQSAGFETVVHTRDDVSPIWRRLGVPDAMSSCHLAVVEPYAVVGHVPPGDVRRLLRERPRNAIGIAVPGMPVGSPGMEASGRTEPYETMLILRNGSSRVFARHG